MKTVMSAQEVMHKFAHGGVCEKTPSRNVFIENDTIYSYGHHFAMARRIVIPNKLTPATIGVGLRNEPGQTIFLVNCNGYSVTTSKHMSWLRQALRNNGKMFEVNRPDYDVKDQPADYVSRYNSERENAKQAKSEITKYRHCLEARRLAVEMREFCKLFKLPTPRLQPLPVVDMEKVRAHEDSVSARRDRQEIIRLARQNHWHENLKIENAKSMEDKIAEWRAGSRSSSNLPLNAPTMLRIDGESILTSKGAKVPKSEAARAIRLLERLTPTDYPMVSVGIPKLGDYPVTSFDGHKLVVGCHEISWSEIVNLKALLAEEELLTVETVSA